VLPWHGRCRKLSEAGSQQLLLDTQAIKALLLDFPSAGCIPFLPFFLVTQV
jgi:hypothetical protein